ncbi:MAG: TonB-dependent receptor [Rudanella sp.]|nr:TonB-dependent receptor [Rudanella sp.]
MSRIAFRIAFLLFIGLLSGRTLAQTTQTLRGRVVEQGTQQPIVGGAIALNGSTLGTLTDAEGYFRLPLVPLGRQTVVVSALGYEPQTVADLDISSGKEVVLTIQLVEQATQLKEVTVRYNREQDPLVTNSPIATLSAWSFNVEETKRYAGSLGDPSRMAANFAGVVANNDSRNDIIVRGNSPLGLVWQLEGMNIPNPNHYGSTYNTGGVVSMLNNNVLAKSDFFTSAFPANYGNGVSGVFDLRLREGNNERREYLAQLGFNGFELGAEGPLRATQKKPAGRRASYLINYRYTALGLLRNLGVQIGTTSPPLYQDVNLKLSFPLRDGQKITIFGLGGISQINLLGKDVDTTRTDFYGRVDQNIYPEFRTAIGGVTYEARLSARTFAKVVAGVTYANQLYREDSIAINEPRRPAFLVTDATFTSLKYALVADLTHKINARNSLFLGGMVDYSQTEIFRRKAVSPTTQRIWANFDEALVLTQTYLNWRWRASNQLTINSGLHLQYLNINQQAVVEPRVGVSYRVGERAEWTLGYGLHHQTQGAYTYFVLDPAGNATNRSLRFSRSHHVVAGYKTGLGQRMSLKIETYYQALDQIPVHPYPSPFSLLNEGSGAAPIDQFSLINAGTGRNYGLDLTLERPLQQGLYILVTGSLFNSNYRGSDGVWRNTAFNTNYVLNLLGGREWKLKRPGSSFALNIRFTTTGGRYFTPLNLAASRRAGEPVEDLRYSFAERQPAYLRLDLKAAYKRSFRRTALELALDLQNATNNQNVFRQGYNRTNNLLSTEYQQGFFPVPTIRFTF